ncbi:disease resistance RPP13-like protein 4 [Cryptomeria japonica]|uniref:disease resistance RPP13-like protein 4 n=1 Tax=Cryptomeria japonica TaxID=3369 RepID=UPI0027DA2010|nr:disease resistance RPP13-like protein 4 [Cryptomeria japonica]
MTDAIVQIVLDRLTSILLQRASLVIYFRENLEELVDWLKYIRALLIDANRRSSQEQALKIWLCDLQNVVYDAEDLFEDCQSMTVTHHGCLCISPARLLFRYRMGKRVSQLMSRVDTLKNLSQAFNLATIAYSDLHPSSINEVQVSLQRSILVRDTSKIVGLDDSIDLICSWVLEEANSSLITVVGMGGLGKTLLLTQVFQRARENFEIWAWLTISQNYSVKQVQERLGRELKLPDMTSLSVEEARNCIFHHLKGRRSLIVLDDVWNGRHLLHFLGVPEEDCCKIVISTRNRKVVEGMREDYKMCAMPHLSDQNSWKLFCLYAFPQHDGFPPEELRDVAEKIARKCANLPLAIKTVAASMATKLLPSEWNDVLLRLSQMDDIGEEVMPVLQISYDELPSDVKLCFLYCSAFPEDCRIDCQYLIKLWIAEGFVPSDLKREALDIGRDYLNLLVSSCLIEAFHVDQRRRIKYCKMHDLLRDFALRKSEEEMKCVFKAGNELNEFPLQYSCGQRKISLMESGLTVIPESSPGLQSLRTLLIAEGSKIEELPESITQLHHLQYLNVSYCHMEKLPWGIGHLKYLRHLDFCTIGETKLLPKGVSLLKSLQFLNLGDYDLLGGNGLRFEDLKGLTKLRELQAHMTVAHEGQRIAEGAFGGMHKLRRLSLANQNEYLSTGLPGDMANMSELEKIKLTRYLPSNFLCSFANLIFLTLVGCHCVEYPRLDELPNLRYLQLCENCENRLCKELPSEFGRIQSFPKLEQLYIVRFPQLEKLPKLHKGAMPMVKELHLKDLPRVKQMAEGLEHLNVLQCLFVHRCIRWQNRLTESGQDFQKLRANLPQLKIDLRGS